MALDIVAAEMMTAHGRHRKEVFNGLVEGQVAAQDLIFLDPTKYRCHRAYEIAELDEGPMLRGSRWVVHVVNAVLSDIAVPPPGRLKIIVGTGLREQASIERWAVSGEPFTLAQWDYQSVLQDCVSGDVEIFTVVNACSASLGCLSLAEDMLNLDLADMVIVVGVDTLCPSMYGLLDRVNGQCPSLVQPFDKQRRGVLMGEGAAAVAVRRSGESAERETVLGRLLTTVQNCDAHHETAPDLASLIRAMSYAHDSAAVSAEDIDLVITHGTGTQQNDKNEAMALDAVFGELAKKTSIVTGIKGMTGHTSGASGLVSLITALEIFSSGKIPPAPTLTDPIEELERLDVVRSKRHAKIDLAQVNAFGFGGVNAVTVVERCHE